MQASLKFRQVIPEARRVVVKIGSRVIVQKSGRPDKRQIQSLVTQISGIMDKGHEVAMVSSGAVGAGMATLGMDQRPDHLPDLQMAAAVGQLRLMSTYSDYFAKRNYNIGQLLLTHADFRHKMRCNNARRTMEHLLRRRVIPIINENDVVADEEIRADAVLGDNDYLASLVVNLIRADVLILLSTVDGLREPGAAGRTKRVRYLESVTRKTFDLVHQKDSPLSKGGMASKLKAAQKVSRTGTAVVIANGRDKNILQRIMAGDDVGTMIVPA
jgi:glutamate 5-kinase